MRPSRGSWLALALALTAPLASAQIAPRTGRVQAFDPHGRPIPRDFFIVRDARGRELATAPDGEGRFTFTDVGRKVTFEFTQRGLKSPGFELVLEDAPVVYVSMMVDPFTGRVKYLAQKPQREPERRTEGRRLGRTGLTLAPPVHDECANALPILDGVTAFSTVEATTDGAPVPGAQYDGQTYEDVWYLYTPSCNGSWTVSTCGSASYDTDLVIYEADTDGDGDFDALDAASITSGAEPALAANDDAGSCAGFTSEVSATVAADRLYLVRLGGFGPGDEGTGTLSVTCGGAPANDICTAPRALECGTPVVVTNSAATEAGGDPAFGCAFAGAQTGDGTLWFTFTATAESAFLSTDDSVGVTDTLLAVYAGDCSGLIELACDDDGGDSGLGLLSELCVSGLSIGERYVVQVASYPGADRGRITLALECPGPCDVDCDDVLQACDLACGGSVTADNTQASTDPLDPDFSCRFGGPEQGVHTLWLRFVASAPSAKIDTNASMAFDTLLAVYGGSPGALVELACSDDEGVGLLSELCVEGLTVGATYYVQAASYGLFDTGEITVGLVCPCAGGLPNDDCADALALDALPASVTVDLTEATEDVLVPCDVFSGPYANVWYAVTGTGNTLTASTCNAGTVVSDTVVSVFCGECGAPVCVGGNDDDCSGGGPVFASTATWCTQAGARYLVTVGTFSAATTPGVVQLDVFDTGSPCAADVQCLPAGACCLAGGECVTTTEGECATQGGAYQGDGTSCVSELVADGGFEAGAFSGQWLESSTNFGSPICNAGCGFGGGTGPRTGDDWCWFGGIFAFEEGSVEQSVTIPAGATTLDFYLEIPVSSGNGVDVLRVSIDGTTVFEVLEGDAVHAGVGYDLVSVPIDAFADGGQHDLRFESLQTGMGPGGAALTNFFVDDVSLAVETFECTECITLDFETEDDLATPLGNGQRIDTEFGALVALSGAGANLGPTTFDSTPGGPNDPSINHDMLIGHGNLLLLQDSRYPGQGVPGFFDAITDDRDGGDLVFDFVEPVDPQSVLLVDINPPPNLGASVTLIDVDGRTRVYTVDPGWTGTYGNAGPHRLDLTTLLPQPGNGTPRFARAVEQPGFLQGAVVRIVVHMTGFGAMDELVFCR